MRCTVCVSTKDRRAFLHQTLWSLRNQSYREWDLVLIDDDSAPWNPQAWQTDPFYGRILTTLVQEEHRVQILPGPKIGKAGAAFQAGFAWAAQYWKENELFFRCDDDSWLPPEYMEKLVKHFERADVGAAAGLVFQPGQIIETLKPTDARYKHGTMAHLSDQINLQWFRHEKEGLLLCEHLHHIQILRAEALEKINGFDTELYHGYREETQYSYRVFLEGYKVLIDPTVECWHLKAPTGGLNNGNFLNDVRTFNVTMKSLKPGIHINLGHAIGDAIMATPMIEELKKANPDREITVWHPFGKAVFEGNPNVDAIANDFLDAQRTARLTGSVYGWAGGQNWKGHLTEAYGQMMNAPLPSKPFPKLYGFNGHKEKIIVIAPWSMANVIDMRGPSHNKNWFEEQWAQLTAWLQTEYPEYAIVQIGDFTRYHDKEPVIPLSTIFEGSLREAWQKIKSARLLISVDTAAQHVAAAFGTPSVVLWGRSKPVHFGYEAQNIINLQGVCPGMPVKQKMVPEGKTQPEEITVIQDRPCVQSNQFNIDHSPCPLQNRPCMASITVSSVMDAVKELMKDAR